jgi:hypothetical protein
MAEAEPQNPAPVAPQVPYPLAIVICDALHMDPATGKKTILGTFTAFQSTVFPFKSGQMVVYLALTDGRGKIPFELRLVRVDNEDGDQPAIFTATGELECIDPLAVMEIGLGMKGIEFPSPGEYRFQFYACGDFVIERRLVVIDTAAQEQP